MGGADADAVGETPRLRLVGAQGYRWAVENKIIPRMRAFDPDLIFISAGFDAALGDVQEALRRRADAARAAEASDDAAALRRGVVEEYRAERALLWAMVAHALREHSSRLAVSPSR